MFDYIIDKINNATIINEPFPHLDIQQFLSEEHLNIILNDKQIHFKEMNTNSELYKLLITTGWKIQAFPGCVANWESYISSISNYKSSDPVETVGITFRLNKYKNKIIEELIRFMNSDIFHNTLRKKFNIKEETTVISAIQKNLTGYEISPHPDIRNKCLTYLLNINNAELEQKDCHTQLLEFKPKYKYIEDYWNKNTHIERCWVPWDWCNRIKTMNKNNSMIIFKPDSSPPTLHAVKLDYNHLLYQRTQIYGNLMYKQPHKYLPSNYKVLNALNT
jgi:hypothetical protein